MTEFLCSLLDRTKKIYILIISLHNNQPASKQSLRHKVDLYVEQLIYT